MLGLTYVGGIYLGYGVGAAYVAIILDWVWRSIFVGARYYRRNWITYGQRLMRERDSVGPTDPFEDD